MEQKVGTLLAEAKRQRRRVSKLHLAKVIGYLQFASLALHSGRVNLLPLYAVLNQVDGWKQKQQVTLNATATRLLTHYWQHPPTEDEGRA